MVTIKGWKKIGENAWRNNDTIVGIVAWGSRGNKILYSPRYAILERSGGARGIAIKRGGFTKSQALKFANAYMRSH